LGVKQAREEEKAPDTNHSRHYKRS
jgi:hypothetical protein